MRITVRSHAPNGAEPFELRLEYVGVTPETLSGCEREIVRRGLLPIMHELSGRVGIAAAHWDDECPYCAETLDKEGRCPRQKDHDEVNNLVSGVEL